MFKLMITFKKKKGMSRQEFIDYYDNKHLALAKRILPPLELHRRNYIVHDDPFLGNVEDGRAVDERDVDFDVITEAFYASREAALASMAALFNGDTSKQIMEDEDKFCDRSSIKFYVVEVHQTAIPW